jgi:hypothetical protein
LNGFTGVLNSKVMKILDIPRSGSYAGVTSSHNRAGQYVRNRRSPVQPVGTGRRAIMRNNVGTASKAYGALTASQQAAWAAYANSYPITDALGSSIKLTGHQMYVAVNAQLLNCGASQTSVPPVSNAVYAVGSVTLTAVHAGAITLTLPGNGTASDFVLVAFSAPQSGGRGFCKTFWQMMHTAGNVSTAQVVTTAYVAQFGAIAAGQRIFYRITPVNQYGVTGTPVIGFVTVT